MHVVVVVDVVSQVVVVSVVVVVIVVVVVVVVVVVLVVVVVVHSCKLSFLVYISSLVLCYILGQISCITTDITHVALYDFRKSFMSQVLHAM